MNRPPQRRPRTPRHRRGLGALSSGGRTTSRGRSPRRSARAGPSRRCGRLVPHLSVHAGQGPGGSSGGRLRGSLHLARRGHRPSRKRVGGGAAGDEHVADVFHPRSHGAIGAGNFRRCRVCRPVRGVLGGWTRGRGDGQCRPPRRGAGVGGEAVAQETRGGEGRATVRAREGPAGGLAAPTSWSGWPGRSTSKAAPRVRRLGSRELASVAASRAAGHTTSCSTSAAVSSRSAATRTS